MRHRRIILPVALLCISGLFCSTAIAQSPLTAPSILLNAAARSGIVSPKSVAVTMTGPAGATIYYTTTGSTPSPTSNAYSAGFSISDTGVTVIKAYAVKSGWLDSPVTTAYVQVDPSAGLIKQTNLYMWLKSDMGVVSSGGVVSAWTDMSANNLSVIQTNASNRPTLVDDAIAGLPAVDFNSTNQQFFNLPSTNVFASNGLNFFIVCKPANQTQADTRILEYGSGLNNNNLAIALPSDNNFQFIGNYSVGTMQSITLGYGSMRAQIPELIDVSLSSNHVVKASVNGIPQLYEGSLILQPPGSTRAQNFLGSGTNGFSNAYFNGQIAEVLCYSTTLSESDRAAVQSYLVQKYRLGQNPLQCSFLPASGTTFSTPSQIVINAPSDAVVRYSVNSPATIDSPIYMGPIPVNYSQTIYTRVTRGAESISNSATYTLDSGLWPKPGCD